MTERIYLNHAGTSWPKAPGVAEAMAEALTIDPSEYGPRFEQARADIAAFFGIGDPQELLLTPGCTSALAGCLLSLPWEDGDVVVTSSVEHRAMLTPVESLVRLRGVNHHPIAYRPGAPFDLDELDEVLAQGRVRAVAVTAASNVTGEQLPIGAIIDRAHAAGAFAIIDGAQTAGLLPIRLLKLGADAFAFAGHKSPLGPQGIGGLWLSPNAEFALRPGYCDVGSVNLAGAAGLATALNWISNLDVTRRQHPLKLRQRLAELLEGRDDVRLLGAPGPSTSALSFLLDTVPLADAEAHFANHGITLRAGRHCAPQALEAIGQPQGTIRVSFGPFNEASDVEGVVRAIDGVRAK